MKKLTAFICLLCTLLLCTGALAAPGDAYLFTDDQKKEWGIDSYNDSNMAAIDDTIYTLWGSDLYAWTVGSDIPEKLASNLVTGYYSSYDEAVDSLGDEASRIIQHLLSDGSTIYGLNDLNGYLYPLAFTEGTADFGDPVQLDWSHIDELHGPDNYIDITSTYIIGNTLYMLVRNDNDYDNPALTAFDLATGEEETYDISSLQGIAPYRDGKLVLEIYDYQTAYNPDTGEMANPTLAIFDPADESVTEIGLFGNSNVFGLAYDEESDTLYYATNSMLMAMPALGEATQVAFMPVDNSSGAPACILPGGLYAIYVWSGLVVRNTDPSYMPTTSLSIYNSYISDAATAFMTQYPNVPLIFNHDTYFESASALAQAMASGDNSFDIYYFDLSYQDFENLMQKGYCLDLTPYTNITDQLQQLYPFIQSSISQDGSFYAVPTNLYSSGLSIYPKTWEKLDIEDMLPTSFMGLIDFIQWWIDEGIDEYPDIQLMEYAYDYRNSLYYLALNMYTTQFQAEGKELTFDTPLFKEIFSALEALDFDALNETIPEDDMEFYDSLSYEDMISSCLFSDYGDWLNVYAGRQDSDPLVLPLEDGGASYIPANISCAFVNPNSENKELAVQYLQCILDHMDPSQHVMIFPDDNEPVINTYYEETMSYYEEALADAQASLETAAPEDVKDIEASIADYEDMIAQKDTYYWQVSPESLASYREYAALAYAKTPDVFSYSGNDDAYTEIHSLISRYMDGQIELDQFITQANQKIRMIQLEGE